MKTVYLLIALTLSMGSKAQIEKVSLQASGLTCSMCSNSINKALKTLDFVEKVDANVRNYTFEIYFKDKDAVDFNKIRRKVEGAGFTVSAFKISVRFDHVPMKMGNQLTIGKNTLVLTNSTTGPLDGLKELKLLDKGFVPEQHAKRISFESTTSEAIYHATI